MFLSKNYIGENELKERGTMPSKLKFPKIKEYIVEGLRPEKPEHLRLITPEKSIRSMLRELKIENETIKNLIETHQGLSKKNKLLRALDEGTMEQDDFYKIILTHPDAAAREPALKILGEIFKKSDKPEGAYKELARLVAKGLCSEDLANHFLNARGFTVRASLKKTLTEWLDEKKAEEVDTKLKEGKINDAIEFLTTIKDRDVSLAFVTLKNALSNANRKGSESALKKLSEYDKQFADRISRTINHIEDQWPEKPTKTWRSFIEGIFKDVEVPPSRSARNAIDFLKKLDESEVKIAYKITEQNIETFELFLKDFKVKLSIKSVDDALKNMGLAVPRAAIWLLKQPLKYMGISGAGILLGGGGYWLYSYLSEKERRKMEEQLLLRNLKKFSIIPLDKLSQENKTYLEENPRIWVWLDYQFLGKPTTWPARDEMKKMRGVIEKSQGLLNYINSTITSLKVFLIGHSILKKVLESQVPLKGEESGKQNAVEQKPTTIPPYPLEPQEEAAAARLAKLEKTTSSLLPMLWLIELGLKKDKQREVEKKNIEKNLNEKKINLDKINNVDSLASAIGCEKEELKDYIDWENISVYKNASEEDRNAFKEKAVGMEFEQAVAMQLIGISLSDWLEIAGIADIKNNEEKADKINKKGKVIEDLRTVLSAFSGNAAVGDFVNRLRVGRPPLSSQREAKPVKGRSGVEKKN